MIDLRKNPRESSYFKSTVKRQTVPSCLGTPSQKQLLPLWLEFCKGIASSAASHWICLYHGSLQTVRTLAIAFKNVFFGITGTTAYLAFAFLHGTLNRLSMTQDQYSWLLIFLVCLAVKVVRYLLLR